MYRYRKKHKIYFRDPSAMTATESEASIVYDGTPFIIERRKAYDCQHGVDRNVADKKRYLDNRTRKSCCWRGINYLRVNN
jgi:hypothetical protein